MKVTFKPHNSLPATSRMVHVDNVFVGVVGSKGFHWHIRSYRKYSDDEKWDIDLQIEAYRAVMKIRERLKS